MGRIPEPDEVDIVVEGRASSEESLQETIDFINEYKRRPGYAEELREARKILETVKMNSKDYGIPDPAALLEHWKRCVADLTRDDPNGQANGKLP